MALLYRYHHYAHFTDEKVKLREAKQFAQGLQWRVTVGTCALDR